VQKCFESNFFFALIYFLEQANLVFVAIKYSSNILGKKKWGNRFQTIGKFSTFEYSNLCHRVVCTQSSYALRF
jgi:hypothetical protein